eukprot:Pgem_evm1s8296
MKVEIITAFITFFFKGSNALGMITCNTTQWTEWSDCIPPADYKADYLCYEDGIYGRQFRNRTFNFTIANEFCDNDDLLDQKDCTTNDPRCMSNALGMITCDTTQWTEWSDCIPPADLCTGDDCIYLCSEDGIHGRQFRNRTFTIANESCDNDDLLEQKDCMTNDPRCMVNCLTTEWNEALPCVPVDPSQCTEKNQGTKLIKGTTLITREIIVKPLNGGSPCGTLTKTIPCEIKIPC